MTSIIALALILFFPVAGQAALRTQTIEYKDGSVECEGYLAYTDSVGTDLVMPKVRPGVIIAHEWTGLGDYARRRTEMLAKMGYVAFAIDMYGKGVRAKDHEEAAKLSGIYRNDRALMRRRAKAGLQALLSLKALSQTEVDKNKIAAIGYCFGGTTVLELARSGENLLGVASFHGGLDSPTPANPGDIKSKVIVFQGANDAYTLAGLDKFKDEMKKSGADWQLIEYSGAVHSFTVKEAGNDPSKGMAYNEAADRRSWQALKNFLDEIFKK